MATGSAIACIRPAAGGDACSHSCESRVLDTDDIGRVWRAVFAALRALELKVSRVESWDRVSAARPAGETDFELQVAVSPWGDAQLMVRVEPVAASSNAAATVSSEAFFTRLSQELYLTAHRA